MTVNGISGKLSATFGDNTIALSSGVASTIDATKVSIINKSTDRVDFKSIDLVYEIVKNA